MNPINTPTSKIDPQLLKKYEGKTCLVTGGASFIGSNLVDALAQVCESVVVVDDFSSGRIENLIRHVDNKAVSVIEADLSSREQANMFINEVDVLFNLAAVHGGRGFIEAYPSKMMVNLAIDNNVFSAAHSANVRTIVHASSACAYPVASQEDPTSRGLLEESMAGFQLPEQSFPDGAYGWVKLMGEYQLKNLAESSETIGRSARIFTAYGERENESHAAVALIAKSLLKMDPFPIWGSGLQTRNFTYVSDTVTGLLHLGADERSIPYDVFNIGARKHNTVLEFLDVVFEAVGWRPSIIDKQMDQPMGVGNRASNNTKIQEVFGWEPAVDLTEGVMRTLSWYEAWQGRSKSVAELESRLVSR